MHSELKQNLPVTRRLACEISKRLHRTFSVISFLQMTAEEEERRRVRRQRNKVAASKCRIKRKNHVRSLLKVNIFYFHDISKSCPLPSLSILQLL